MATITPKEKDGKIIAFKFRTCVGRDENGRQVSRTTTWQVPENLSMVRLEKAAQRAAADWEKQARAEYEKDLYDPERIKAREVDRTKTDFVRFVLEEWYPICIDNGERKPKTVSFYHDTTKNIVAHFQGQIVQKISAPAIGGADENLDQTEVEVSACTVIKNVKKPWSCISSTGTERQR